MRGRLLFVVAVIMTVMIGHVVFFNFDVLDLDVRNFSITVVENESGEKLPCTMIITGADLVNGTYPPVEWQGYTNGDGLIQGWLAPGNYGVALSCGMGQYDAMPFTMTVNYLGRTQVQLSGERMNARNIVLRMPSVDTVRSTSSECDCTPPSTPEPTPDLKITPTPIFQDEPTPEPTLPATSSI